MPQDLAPVGRVAELWRYPVKSMAGERLEAADVAWNGLAGDRRWAFVRPDALESTFPWLTIRQRSDMVHYVPTLADREDPNASPTRVRTPRGTELDVTDPALRDELGEGVTLLRQGRGSFDAAPLSLVSSATARAIAEESGTAPDVRRFRPNVVVDLDGPGGEPFAEDAWVGRTLRIGGVRMRVDRRDPRCVVVNVDPDTAERDARVLRATAQRHEGQLGVYGQVVEPGRVALGDPVTLEGEVPA